MKQASSFLAVGLLIAGSFTVFSHTPAFVTADTLQAQNTPTTVSVPITDLSNLAKAINSLTSYLISTRSVMPVSQAVSHPSDGLANAISTAMSGITNGGTFTDVMLAGTATANNLIASTATINGSLLLKGPVPYINVKAYGAKGDGVTDDTAAIQAAINSITDQNRTLYFPGGTYLVSSTLQINTRNLTLLGMGNDRQGSTLDFTGSGALIQLGTDNGHAYDLPEYSGVQGLTVQQMTLTYGGATQSTLTNGMSYYGPNTYGIRDWRGGSIDLEHVTIEHFDYGFWGIQSDVDRFNAVAPHYNHSAAIYLGPRSDQAVIEDGWSYLNDRVLWLDRAQGARIIGWQSDDDGNQSTAPFKIGSQWTQSSTGIEFLSCWFEQDGSNPTAPGVDAFVELGVGDSVSTNDVAFTNSYLLLHPQNAQATDKASHFLKIGNATGINVDGLQGDTTNLINLLEFTGTTSPDVRVSAMNSQFTGYDNLGSGSPHVYKTLWGSSMISLLPSDSGMFTIGTGSPFQIDTSGNTLLQATSSATVSTTYNSPALTIQAAYWTGSASGKDQWVFKDSVGTGANGQSQLSITHSGSTNSGNQITIGALTYFGQGANGPFGNGTNAWSLSSAGDISQRSIVAATNSANFNSPTFALKGTYWDGSASQYDAWSMQSIMGSGSNPVSRLNITHSGTSGSSYVTFPSGSVAIGTSSPSQTLTVNGSVGFPGIGNGAGTAYICETIATGVLSTSTTACNPSSIRFKENIQTLTSDRGLSLINQLRPVTYIYKPDMLIPGNQIGFIAEEVYPILPEVVGLDASGTPANIDYAKLTPVIVKAIQELAATTSATSTNGQTITFSSSFLENLGYIGGQVEGGVAHFAELVVDKLTAKSVTADDLTVKNTICINSTCVTEDQLKALLSQISQSSASSSTDTSSSTSSDTSSTTDMTASSTTP